MHKMLMVLTIALAFLYYVAGRLVVAKLTDGAADQAGKSIAEYCKLPAEARAEFRAKVAARAAPHSARIDCAP